MDLKFNIKVSKTRFHHRSTFSRTKPVFQLLSDNIKTTTCHALVTELNLRALLECVMPKTRKIKIKKRHTVPWSGQMFFFVENNRTKLLVKTKSVPDLRSLKRSKNRSLYRQKSENSEHWSRRLARLMLIYLEFLLFFSKIELHARELQSIETVIGPIIFTYGYYMGRSTRKNNKNNIWRSILMFQKQLPGQNLSWPVQKLVNAGFQFHGRLIIGQYKTLPPFCAESQIETKKMTDIYRKTNQNEYLQIVRIVLRTTNISN